MKVELSDWHGCPARFAAGNLGDKWIVVILRDMLFAGRQHYAEFLTAPEAISTNILAERLARMVAAELVTKVADPENGKSYIYELTDRGRALRPVLIEMMRWSVNWDQRTESSPEAIEKLAQR